MGTGYIIDQETGKLFAFDRFLILIVLNMAKCSYNDLQNEYCVRLRKHGVLDMKKMKELTDAYIKTHPENSVELNKDQTLTLLTACDITRKMFSSHLFTELEVIFSKDRKVDLKGNFRKNLRPSIIALCKEMITYYSEVSEFEDAVEERMKFLKRFVPK